MVDLSQSLKLHGLTAVITGSSSGIGRSIALRFAAEGAKSILCVDLRPEHPPSDREDETIPTHEIIQAKFGSDKATFIACDVSIEKGNGASLGMAEVIERTVQTMGRIDVIVNCAGKGFFGVPLHNTSLEAWQNQLSVNATGAFLGMKHAITQFLTQNPDEHGFRGVIINISSIGAQFALRGCGAYCASKAALVGASRSVAVDYAEQGIRCNVLLPGYIDTPMLRSALDEHKSFEDYLNTSIPARRLGRPRDVAGAAVWLASNADSAYVTGVALTVDGGFTAI